MFHDEYLINYAERDEQNRKTELVNNVLNKLLRDGDKEKLKIFGNKIKSKYPRIAYYAVLNAGDNVGIREVSLILLDSQHYSDWGKAYWGFKHLGMNREADIAYKKTLRYLYIQQIGDIVEQTLA